MKEVCLELSRSEDDSSVICQMYSFYYRLLKLHSLQQNWYDTLESMKNITDCECTSMGLRLRLLNFIKLKMGNNEITNTSTKMKFP